MNTEMMAALAKEFRAHISYQGDVAQFDTAIFALIMTVEQSCAQIVLDTPLQLFAIATPKQVLSLIAAAIQGKVS